MVDLSKDNFYKFIDNYSAITSSSSSTAGNVRSVCYLVKEFIPNDAPADQWDAADIIDTYDLINGIAEDTKKSYISRFNGAIAKFIAYQNGESVSVKQRRTPTRSNFPVYKDAVNTSVKTFELPIPLREELTVMIGNLPRDLTKDEAKRISTIIESFAISEAAKN
ncbi:hypothetical protein ACN6UN_002634 [Cronobacter turicensis]|uniref:hypothetical protein n=1 Tax=Cronobacter malonaticus TaxID=413503 RepID=UPI0028961387|nr:hypothetical protein [Cronobacter malonaticus]MDT3621417.1 hypothetical protein [Cronobacter malonaticus]